MKRLRRTSRLSHSSLRHPKVQALLPLTPYLPSREREGTSQSADRLNPHPGVHCKTGCCRDWSQVAGLQTEGKGSELELLNLIWSSSQNPYVTMEILPPLP